MLVTVQRPPPHFTETLLSHLPSASASLPQDPQDKKPHAPKASSGAATVAVQIAAREATAKPEKLPVSVSASALHRLEGN